MKVPIRVDNFLGCMQLETGGIVIGFLFAIGTVLMFGIGATLLIFSIVIDCDDLKADAADGETGFDKERLYEYECIFGRGITMFIAVIIVILSIGFFIIGYLCIRGTYRRNHIHLRPMLVVIAVGIVLSLLELLQLIYTSDVRSIGSTLVGILIYTYEFIVIDSLHDLFREEYDRKHSVQYHSTLQKV